MDIRECMDIGQVETNRKEKAGKNILWLVQTMRRMLRWCEKETFTFSVNLTS
jgi:hypothetical protein